MTVFADKVIQNKDNLSETSLAVLNIAEKWLGTPYRHQASLFQTGCDCLGLIRGIWRELYGAEPEPVQPYSAEWNELDKDEYLLTALRRHFYEKPEIEINCLKPGDLIVFRWKEGLAAKHLGIMGRERRFIHAYEGSGVVSSALVPQWQKKIAAIFTFPDLKV